MKQQIKKLKKKKTLGQIKTNCMLKIFYIILWKQLFQYRNGKGKHNTVRRWDNLRIMIVGRKLKNN